MHWKIARRTLSLERPLVMAILNVTPDSFSDGGRFALLDDALRRVEEIVAEGADIIDIGGESTRPGSQRVSAEDECERVIPVIAAIAKRFDVPVSIDTSKAQVARAATEAGAEIINDIAGLRWDAEIAAVAAASGAGLVLMHSRGEFETMHSEPPVADVIEEVAAGLRRSIAAANERGVMNEQIVLDIGIGFGKTPRQNLELLAKLDKLSSSLPGFPLLVGASRKSFIAKTLGDMPPEARLPASLAAAAVAVMNGAQIIRAHDVRETVQAVRLAAAILEQR
ncbi:MAG: dihydropteroate synthase [Acidobacteria bacterium]|nr:dihydropteroate synthase [Acidobacteriota bacterium]